MPDNTQPTNWQPRNYLAYAILILSVIAITGLAIVAITVDAKNALVILNVVLPVIASWVGTIMAFYFGRENYDSANVQVRGLIRELNPEERAGSLVTDIMRRFSDITYFKIPEDKSDADIKLKDLRAYRNITRLPIVDSNNYPKYILHQSMIDYYLVSVSGASEEDDTLKKFIDDRKVAEPKREFGLNKGFIVVPETLTVAAAREKLEQTPPCQDIFITKGGTEKEPLLGWISNVRLAKFLKR